MLITMRDSTAKIGEWQDAEEVVMGKEALKCVRNDNGKRKVAFCDTNNLVITETTFTHKDIHKYAWTSPDGQTRNQFDHVVVNSRFRWSVSDMIEVIQVLIFQLTTT